MLYALGGIGNVILMGILAIIFIGLAVILIGAHIENRKQAAMVRAQYESNSLRRRIALLEAEAPDYEVWLEELHSKVNRQFFPDDPRYICSGKDALKHQSKRHKSRAYRYDYEYIYEDIYIHEDKYI